MTRQFLLPGALLLAGVAGCANEPAKGPAAPGPKRQDPPPANVKKDPPGLVQNVVRKYDGIQVLNMLRNLGQAYIAFEITENRGPKNYQELGLKDATIGEALNDGSLTFIWNTGKIANKSGTVLAYETHADGNGMRYVLLADGTPTSMDSPTFAQMNKALGK